MSYFKELKKHSAIQIQFTTKKNTFYNSIRAIRGGSWLKNSLLKQNNLNQFWLKQSYGLARNQDVYKATFYPQTVNPLEWALLFQMQSNANKLYVAPILVQESIGFPPKVKGYSFGTQTAATINYSSATNNGLTTPLPMETGKLNLVVELPLDFNQKALSMKQICFEFFGYKAKATDGAQATIDYKNAYKKKFSKDLTDYTLDWDRENEKLCYLYKIAPTTQFSLTLDKNGLPSKKSDVKFLRVQITTEGDSSLGQTQLWLKNPR